MGADYHQGTKPPRLQDPGQVTEAAPGQNIWFNALTNLQNARIIHVLIMVAGVGETLECEIIADGITWAIFPLAAAAGTNYFLKLRTSALAADVPLVAVVDNAGTSQGFLVEGRQDVSVRVRKTTLNGAGVLSCKVLYGLY